MSDGSRFLGGALLGILLGAVLALLYAPERGDKTRKKWARRGGEWFDDASDSAGDWVEKGRKKIGL